ncbi:MULTISPECIES: hypothetical protein [Paenibacillus]|uniref:hypothetical protein n=1 Tax=Paenibacillus TaxID=44249 RepID=UPI0007BEB78A|nr:MULTISPECIES: hypothetical protein [Paenibacillus]MCZ1264306.1 hypothetical protein [Paenibacillus tundrae]SDK93168.1 hypothetical protein SAMN05428961_103281 [Paenibacillus sp. OK060]SEB19029.1 hypothetical protein SAMN03159332_4169 [Paenibacillus sp. 276b]SHN68464.1 hypothetical protein SAMN04487896_2401 [Paenibacillus sp. ov031]
MIPATLEQLEQVRKECRTMVKKRATASAGTTLVPLPGTDVLADVGMLMQLLPAINNKFGLSQKQLDGLDPETKSMIYGFVMSIGSKVIGRMVTKELVVVVLKRVGVRVATKSVAKFVPFAGQGLAAALSFTAMRYVGNKHVEDCYEVVKRMIEQRELLPGEPAPSALEEADEDPKLEVKTSSGDNEGKAPEDSKKD